MCGTNFWHNGNFRKTTIWPRYWVFQNFFIWIENWRRHIYSVKIWCKNNDFSSSTFKFTLRTNIIGHPLWKYHESLNRTEFSDTVYLYRLTTCFKLIFFFDLKDEKKMKQQENDLITINIDAKKIRKNFTEYWLNINFNKLDLILNLETINELIILFYSSYLNFEIYHEKSESNKSEEHQEAQVHSDTSIVENRESSRDYLNHKVNIRFRFDQLNLLLFYMNEQLSQAQKFALLTMNGAYLNMNINSNRIYSQFYLNALNILDLSPSQSHRQNIHQYIFGIGLDKQQQVLDRCCRILIIVIWSGEKCFSVRICINLLSQLVPVFYFLTFQAKRKCFWNNIWI